ncbi:MAG TPA: trimethylamine corrinoid protein 2 [Ruminiclostridium sp.]
MFYKEGWDKSKERLAALWENEVIDRCCVAVPVPKEGKIYEAIDNSDFKDSDNLKKFYTDPEFVLDRNLKKFESTFYGGEALPCAFPNFGTGGHAAYFGCKYKFAKDTIWFFPTISDLEKDKLEFYANNDLLKAEKSVIKYLADQGKSKFFVSMPDNCGSIDAFAHLRGSDNLLLDMLEKPEIVNSNIQKIVSVLKSTNEDFFSMIKDNNDGGSTHAWMHLWAKGKMAQLQCDLSVMISPQMYEAFALPELEQTVNNLDYSVYHLDGQEQIRHLEMILSIKKLNMIQWTPVAGQPPTSDFIPVLKKIQKAGKGLVLLPQVWEVEKLLSELSPKGLQLVVNGLDSEDEAKELIKKVQDWTRII